MRNTYTLLGFSLLLVIGIAVYAFNWGFTNTEDTETIMPLPMASTLTLTSRDFSSGGAIPSKFTCDGEEINPELSIGGVPEGTKSLALLMDDPDIPQVFKDQRGIDSFDHWTLFNIPAPPAGETFEIAQGSTIGLVGVNGAGKNEYAGPCPPPQYEPSEHRYFFRLYALDTILDLPEGASKADVLKAMQGHIIAQTELIGKYRRQ